MTSDLEPPAAEPADVRSGTLRGLSWSASSVAAQQVLQFAFSVVLARLLVPHDFGLLASIYVFIGFANVFVDLGLGWAVIQRTDLTQRHLSSAFLVNVAIGGGMMLLAIALAPAVAAFYDQSQLLPLMAALAPTFLIASLSGVQSALLQRKMDFRSLAIVDVAALVVSNAGGVGMALAGLGVWSLVGTALLAATVRTGLLWRLGSWRPDFGFDRVAIGELWSFSRHLTASGALNYWAGNGDNLLVGRFIGISELGFYSRAYSLAYLLPNAVNSVAGRVMFPALSRLKEDREHVRRAYLRSIRLIAVATFPAVAGLFAVAGPFISTFFGSNWSPVVPILRILCVLAAAQIVAQTTAWIFASQGRTDWLFRWGAFSAAMTILSFVVGVHWGTTGVAVGISTWEVIDLVPLFLFVRAMIGLSLTDVVRTLAGAAVASAVMGALVTLVVRLAPQDWGSGARLAAGIATGVVAYAVALRLVSRPSYRELSRFAGELAARR
jgi:O-antigen/teichoic acid export membrane protein